VFALDKPIGPTAAQALARLRSLDPSLAHVTLGHAGRLDPLAEGLLTVLVGDENRHVHSLRGSDKTYRVEVLLGLASDSFDALGLVGEPVATETDVDALARACSARVGPYVQAYPPFSQARVGGRSLIALARAGVAYEAPTASRVLHALEVLGGGSITMREACDDALARVARVHGDFRQAAVVLRWRAVTAANPSTRLGLATLHVRCSGGTYMRTLARDLGADLGVAAMAWRIRRTAAGDLTLDGARTLPDTPD